MPGLLTMRDRQNQVAMVNGDFSAQRQRSLSRGLWADLSANQVLSSSMSTRILQMEVMRGSPIVSRISAISPVASASAIAVTGLLSLGVLTITLQSIHFPSLFHPQSKAFPIEGRDSGSQNVPVHVRSHSLGNCSCFDPEALGVQFLQLRRLLNCGNHRHK